MPSNSVFISYRRSANPYLALAVYQDLYSNGIDVFYDVENIDAGQFDTIILNQISARVYFMPIFTPGTLDRCLDSGDWVRREIEHAMNENRQIVPLHTPDFDFSDLNKFLPGLIAHELKRWNAIELPQKYFRLVMRDVRERILKPIDTPVKPVPGSDVRIVARKQALAASEPVVTEQQLTAQDYFVQANASRDPERMIENYTEAIRLNPQYAEAYNNRGRLHRRKGEIEQAIADFSEAIRLAPKLTEAYINRGVAYSDKWDWDRAIADYTEALHLDPQNSEVYDSRARIYARKKEFKKAIEDGLKAIEINPDCSDAIVMRQNIERWRKLV